MMPSPHIWRSSTSGRSIIVRHGRVGINGSSRRTSRCERFFSRRVACKMYPVSSYDRVDAHRRQNGAKKGSFKTYGLRKESKQ